MTTYITKYWSVAPHMHNKLCDTVCPANSQIWTPVCLTISRSCYYGTELLMILAGSFLSTIFYLTVLTVALMLVLCPMSIAHVLWLNGASYSKSYSWQPIGSRRIDWYQNEWHYYRSFKVMSTIASHSPLNISETVRDRGLVPKDH